MRVLRGGVAHIAQTIEEDLADRETFLQKPHIRGLADVAACVLSCRSSNTAEWIAVLPRQVGDEKSKERYISRLLANSLINPLSVMQGFIPEIVEMMNAQGHTLILMIDQSKISEGFECLMISLRLQDRAIPVAWKVSQTRGAIGFEIQEKLLDAVLGMIPEGSSVVLAGDRFYGTAALIGWCQSHNWQYRLRLKSNLILEHEGGEITTGDAYKQGIKALEGARFHQTHVQTSIGIVHESGHSEPWIIAMDCKPTHYKVLDYGLRWGIECMFSDFKSRGFCITKTHLQHADRIERLILVLTIALYWAVSTGMRPPEKKRLTLPKKPTDL
jgi:hypothetical protein